jgi:acetyl-CoA carboxylase biotin carboxyl carrier protein
MESMDFKQIQDLIKLINKSNIGEVTIEEKEFKITIKQKKDQVMSYVAPVPQQSFAPYPSHSPAPSSAPQSVAAEPSESAAPPPSKADNQVTIKSPMIGTFYRKPSPDKPLFVEIGDEVSPGKVVCIIEAMKLFNEIESEISGKIIKVLVEDASPVEYDQPLFLVETN